MRRVIAGAIILLLTSFAQAGLVFTVNGDPVPGWAEFIYADTFELGLEIDTGTVSDYTLEYVLGSNAVEFIHDGTQFNQIFEFENGYVGEPMPQGFEIAGYNFEPIQGPEWIMNGLILHRLTPYKDVFLTVTTSDYTVIDGELVEPGTVMQSILFHGVPEPMTIALLGLGGLFVLRSRKKSL